LRFYAGKFMQIGAATSGSLRADGTPADRIIFTGNDAVQGYWQGLRFTDLSDGAGASSVLDNCVISYGGGSGTNSLLYCENTTMPVVTDTEFLNSGAFGLSLLSSSISISGCTFRGNGSYPVNIPASEVNSVVSSNTFVANSSNTFNAFYIHEGTVSTSTIWPAPPAGFTYVIKSGEDIYIHGPSGPVLTLLPETVIKQSGNTFWKVGMSDPGALDATGVTFTSVWDDTVGDADGGGPSEGAPGHWETIQFLDQTIDGSSRLDDCLIRFGGNYSVFRGAVSLVDANPAITNCLFEYNKYSSLAVENQVPSLSLTDCTFQHHHTAALDLHIGAVEAVLAPANGNVLHQNGDDRYNVIKVHAGTLSISTTWPTPQEGFTYLIENNDDPYIHGPAGPVLTILPGTVIKQSGNTFWKVGMSNPGGLNATGVTFTSVWDDTVGDADGLGPTEGEPGQWETIQFLDQTIDGSSQLDNCLIRFGGNYSGFRGTISLVDANPMIRDCLFEHNRYSSLAVENEAPFMSITGCTFQHHNVAALDLHMGAVEAVLAGENGNLLVPNGDGRYNVIKIHASTLSFSTTWPRPPADFTYLIENGHDMYIHGASGPVLTLLPGTVIKQSGNTFWKVGMSYPGGLSATGVTFTSMWDDTVGDADGYGYTEGAPGHWETIQFLDQTIDGSSRLEDCVIRYGGNYSGFGGMIAFVEASPLVRGTRFSYSRYAGLYIYGPGSAPNITCCEFRNNNHGLLSSTSADPSVNHCSFFVNAVAGIENLGANVINAEQNYWGSIDGPSGEGPGSGDGVLGAIDYVPWLTAANPCPGCAAADLVVDFNPGSGTSHATAENILGLSDGEAVPIGLEGSVTLRMSHSIYNAAGADLIVYENGVSMGAIDEAFRVEASYDGTNFFLLGDGSGSPVAFDLADGGLDYALYVRITDLPPQEPGTLPPEVGADIDAIEVIHCGRPDFELADVQVVQAVVSPNLIQGRGAVVRAFIRNIGEAINYSLQVSGRLHVLDEFGAELHTLNASFIWRNDGAFSETDIANGNNAINFYLDPASSYGLGIVGSDYMRRLWIEIDPNNEILELDESNNTNEATPYSQYFRVPAQQRFMYCTASASPVAPYWPEVYAAHKFLSRTYPLRFDPVEDYWINQGHFWLPETIFSAYSGIPDLQLQLHRINLERRLIGLPLIDRLIAFFPHLPGDAGGIDPPWTSSIVLIGADYRGNLGMKVAHELGHTYNLQGEYYRYNDSQGKWIAQDGNYCLRRDYCDVYQLVNWHANECDADISNSGCVNFPPLCSGMGAVIGRYVQETAFDVSEKRSAAWARDKWPSDAERIAYENFYDDGEECIGGFIAHEVEQPAASNRKINFMGSSDLGDQFYWITNDSYELLVDYLIGSGSESVAASRMENESTTDSNQIWIYGFITNDDQVRADSWYLMQTGIPTDELAGTGYSIEFIESEGGSLSSHEFGVSFGNENEAPLAMHLPFPEGTVRIEIHKGGVPIYVRNVSLHQPSVELIAPNGGFISGIVDIIWSAQDADGDSLNADLLYSPDDGINWFPLAFGIEDTSTALNTDLVPGSEIGRIKVIISDGIHVAEDASDSTLRIGGKPPTVTILSPSDSSKYVFGDQILLEAVFQDLEDGIPPSDNMIWISSLDDTIGIGSSLVVSSLQIGTHVISIHGEDSDELIAQDTITLFMLLDTDGDGMPNVWENQYAGMDSSVEDGYLDLDYDKLVNIDEYYYKTNPINPDTDGDGFDDGEEVAASTDPLSQSSNPTSINSMIQIPKNPNIISYPNPFNPVTTLRIEVPKSGLVSLRIYDVSGRMITELLNEYKNAGIHFVPWDGRNRHGEEISSGVYFMRLLTRDGTATAKTVILR